MTWAVGQSVVVVRSRRVHAPGALLGRRYTREESVTPGVVTKIGRLYVFVETYPNVPPQRFRIVDGGSADPFPVPAFDWCRLFPTREAFERMAAARDAWHTFSEQVQPMLFGQEAPAHLTVESIEQLRNFIRHGVVPGGLG